MKTLLKGENTLNKVLRNYFLMQLPFGFDYGCFINSTKSVKHAVKYFSLLLSLSISVIPLLNIKIFDSYTGNWNILQIIDYLANVAVLTFHKRYATEFTIGFNNIDLKLRIKISDYFSLIKKLVAITVVTVIYRLIENILYIWLLKVPIYFQVINFLLFPIVHGTDALRTIITLMFYIVWCRISLIRSHLQTATKIKPRCFKRIAFNFVDSNYFFNLKNLQTLYKNMADVLDYISSFINALVRRCALLDYTEINLVY